MELNLFNKTDDDSDAYKNIAKDAKEYGKLYLQLFKLNTVGVLSQFVSYLIAVIAGVMLLVTVLIFLSMILVLWLRNVTGSAIYSLLIMSGFYLLLFVLLMLFRKRLMLNPIIKKISSILFSKEMDIEADEPMGNDAGKTAKAAPAEPVENAEILKEDLHDE